MFGWDEPIFYSHLIINVINIYIYIHTVFMPFHDHLSCIKSFICNLHWCERQGPRGTMDIHGDHG